MIRFYPAWPDSASMGVEGELGRVQTGNCLGVKHGLLKSFRALAGLDASSIFRPTAYALGCISFAAPRLPLCQFLLTVPRVRNPKGGDEDSGDSCWLRNRDAGAGA